MASRRRKTADRAHDGGILTAEEKILKEVHDAYVVSVDGAADVSLAAKMRSVTGEAEQPPGARAAPLAAGLRVVAEPRACCAQICRSRR